MLCDTNNPLKLGIVGGGEAATKAVSAIKNLSSISIISVVCTQDELLDLIEPSKKTLYYEKLLDSNDVDAIYIATPNNTHIALAHKALAADKHVLIEKPLSSSIEEGQQFLNTIKNRGLVVAVAFKKRYGGFIQDLRNIIINIREDFNIFYKWHLPAPLGNWRYDLAIAGGGIIMDLGSHILDLFEYLFGKISSVYAMVKLSKVFPGIEEYAEIEVNFCSGIKGRIELSWLSKAAHQSLSITTRSRELIWKRVKQDGESIDIFVDTLEIRRKVFDPGDEYRGLFENFHKKLSKGDGELPSIEAGIRNIKIIAAIYESVKLNQMITLL